MSRSFSRAVGLSLATAVSGTASVLFGATAEGAAGPDGVAQTYVVLAPEGQSVARARGRIDAAGGTVLAAYDEIGVVIAAAERGDFLTAVAGAGVAGAAATAGLGSRLEDDVEATVAAPDPATTGEALWAEQWDMQAIQVAEAHSVTTGRSDVVVGVLDSGIDATHPDLATQVDHSLSASCLGGVADPSFAAWQPTRFDHGTHVAGTIGAARNGTGVVGVAPGARLAAVKVADDGGFIYPEAAICGFMWAARHRFDVTNNSYFIDPWEVHCRNDPRQRPAWLAVQRALRYAASQDVLTVAAAGNSQFDLQHTFVDVGSPGDGSYPIADRVVNSACLVLPAEAPGVVTVSATGPTGLHSFFSSYGLGVVEVAAPGGDSRVPGTVPTGRVLSTTWPGHSWGVKQGTSMAAPHVSGVAALVRSLHPDMRPGAITSVLQRTAEAQPCPGRSYTPPGPGLVTHHCYGGPNSNGFYGSGVVNAYRAVTT